MVLTKTLQFTDEINDNPEILNFLDNLTPEEVTIMVISYCHGLMKSKDKQIDLLNHDQINKRVEENTRERTEVLENKLKGFQKKYEKIEIEKESLEEKNYLLKNDLNTAKKEAKEEQKEMDIGLINSLKEDKVDFQKQIVNLTDSIQMLTNTNNNSQKKGKVGEDLTEKRIIPPGWEYENKSQVSHQGDGHLWNPQTNQKILIDSKNYNVKVPKNETKKLIKDVKDNNMKAGVMVSLTSGISHHTKSMVRNEIDLEMIENIPFLFISNANDLSDDTLKCLMVTIDNIICGISGDKNNLIEMKMLKLQNSINMINLSIEHLNSTKKVFSSIEKSTATNICKGRDNIEEAENKLRKILYYMNDNDNDNDNDNNDNDNDNNGNPLESINNYDEISETSQSSEEVQEIVENLITEVSNENNLTLELLNKKTCVELRKLCKEKSIKGVSKSTKNIIIEKILNDNE